MKKLFILVVFPFLLFAQTNYSAYFDGSTIAYKNIAAWRSGDSQGTISFWVKLNGANENFASYVSSADTITAVRRLMLRRGTTNVVQVDERNNDTETAVTTGFALSDVTWHWVVVVSSGTAYTVYIDSVKQSLSGTNTGDWFADIDNRDNIVIGGLSDFSGERFRMKGWIDEVYVDSTAKSAAWVQSVYNGYLENNQDLTDTTTAVAYWRFDQSLEDAVGTADLTISGTLTYSDGAFTYPSATKKKRYNGFNGWNKY